MTRGMLASNHMLDSAIVAPYSQWMGRRREATYDTVSAFARKRGSVTVLDSQGKARKLPSGDKDVFDLIEKADRFMFEARWYTREEFEALMDEAENR